MGTFQRVEEIEAWKEARELTKEIYRITKQKPFAMDYALRDQIRRACISVMSNIAEGFERIHDMTIRIGKMLSCLHSYLITQAT